MKHLVIFLVIWFIFQSFVIGQARVKIYNEIVDGTFACNNEKISKWKSGLFFLMTPLVAFMQDDEEVNDYCKKLKSK